VTSAPIEDGVDGIGVYASRLRSRRSARDPQSHKVLGPCGVHVRSDIMLRSLSAQHAHCNMVGSGGEPVSSYRAMVVVLRKLHPHGGDRCDRKRCQVRACAGAQKRDLAFSK
jgi:hypothetical protein